MQQVRETFKNAKRVVIKVGTSTITYDNGRINLSRIDEIAFVLSDLKNQGLDVVLVTSGAIAAGATKKNIKERPKEISKLQALAAIGQPELMNIYINRFAKYNNDAAQALFTKDSFDNIERRNLAKDAFYELFKYHTIPIVNENDLVAVKEIKFGDNDTLSAYISRLIDADLLIILSDIDGLYTKDPNIYNDAKRISSVKNISEIEHLAKGSNSEFGTGGMVTKIDAAKIATKNGIHVVIANGQNPHCIREIIDGKEVGTLFVAKTKTLSPLYTFENI